MDKFVVEQKQAISKKEIGIAMILEGAQHLYEKTQALEDVVNASSKMNYGYLKEDSLKEEITLSDGLLFQISQYLDRADLIVTKAIRYLEEL